MVRRERTEAGITMAVLGSTLGCTSQQMQNYETGANRIAVVTQIRIAEALCMTGVDLMDEIEVAILNTTPEERSAA